jgi:2-oxo-4-hydroxy-4-carboxy-5-ureidoimidazoline decarboxylase
MLARRPFPDAAALALAAHVSWQHASQDDWLAAFAGHPKIGDVEYLRRRFDNRALGEQGQILSAPDEVLEELARLNHEYLARHGFIFIICASGLGAAQMLAALRARVDRPTDVELAEAAAQHAAINRLRLEGALQS